jgi:hypothetical protein
LGGAYGHEGEEADQQLQLWYPYPGLSASLSASRSAYPLAHRSTSVCCFGVGEFAPKEKRGQSTCRANWWPRFFSALIPIEIRKLHVRKQPRSQST